MKIFTKQSFNKKADSLFVLISEVKEQDLIISTEGFEHLEGRIYYEVYTRNSLHCYIDLWVRNELIVQLGMTKHLLFERNDKPQWFYCNANSPRIIESECQIVFVHNHKRSEEIAR